jgi:hypothetical protein
MLVAAAAPAAAQGFEVSPFLGFRGGGLEVDAVGGNRTNHDSAPALGVIVNVPLSAGLQVEAAFSHQKTGLLTTDHWQAGGLQEYLGGSARPFLTGILGLTRYGSGGDNEIRFTAGAGGGVKLFPAPHVGLRLDGRVFATFLDAEGTALACTTGRCFIALHVHVAWQAEFSAGIIVRVH